MITQGDRLIGTLSVSGKGVGYFTPEGRDRNEALVIEKEHLATALHKDEVQILVIDETTAKVEKIISRNRVRFVCTAKKDEDGTLACFADDTHMYHPFMFIQADAHAGNKYFVEITSWNNVITRPEVEVLEEIGPAGNNETEMRAIVLEAGFDTGFLHNVEQEAEALPRELTTEDIATRRDFRDVATVTIDPADAKDFDDALSLRELDNGEYEVGIHIADVSHYVKPDTALDKEAQKRATSIYLVDRTIPMLPERLSNDLCSLVQGEDRPTFSVVVRLDQDGKVLDRWIGRTVIHSNRRYTYSDAQDAIDTQSGDFYKELTILNNLAKHMQERSENAGALSFHTTEVKFKLAEDGTPLEIYPYQSHETNKMIEQYAVLANRIVAEYVDEISEKNDKKYTFIYRIHDAPSMERISAVAELVKQFGYNLNTEGNKISAGEINRLIEKVEEAPEANLIQMSLLRSMSRAEYSTINIGHFGLAMTHYSHFTSPIRRYPDVMVHRLLDAYLKGEDSPDAAWYIKMAAHSSEMEARATGAERSSVRYKQAEYMENHIGGQFDGVVTGVSKFGIFVETKDTKTEGMMRMRNIGNDFYEFDPKDDVVRGKRTGETIRLGDQMRIKVLGANTERKQIDFARVK
ncbi:MAG: ribonuclease R [bacterium]|nr:ribonuclease R [bacterium]